MRNLYFFTYFNRKVLKGSVSNMDPWVLISFISFFTLLLSPKALSIKTHRSSQRNQLNFRIQRSTWLDRHERILNVFCKWRPIKRANYLNTHMQTFIRVPNFQTHQFNYFNVSSLLSGHLKEAFKPFFNLFFLQSSLH